MKKNKKIKKMHIAIGIALVILIAIASYFLLKKYVFNNDKDDSNEVTKEKLTLKNGKKYLYNNYLISYIIEGDVKLGEGMLMDEEGGPTYYAIDDPLLKDIQSIEDINNLIESTLLPEAAVRANEDLNSETTNTYIQADGTLYMIKGDTLCEDFNTIDLNLDKITISEDEGSPIIWYNTIENRIYNDEQDGKLKFGQRIMGCRPIPEDIDAETIQGKEN